MEQPAGTPSLSAARVYVAARELVNPDFRLPEALEAVVECGADGFELAQEQLPLIADPDDVEDLVPLLARFPDRPALSVPQPLFVAGSLQRDVLHTTLLQSRVLGCTLVTFQLGDVVGATDETLEAMQGIVTRAQARAPEVRITVANDYRPASVDVQRWQWLMERTSRWDAPILMTLDVGAWTCSSGNVVQAAHVLGRYVAYFRVARAISRDGGCAVEEPRLSDSVHPALASLPGHAPRTLACGVAASDHCRVVVILSELIEALRGRHVCALARQVAPWGRGAIGKVLGGVARAWRTS